jgi:hypothetical protein
MAVGFPRRFRQQAVHVVSDTLGRYYYGHLGVGREYPRTNELWVPLYDFAIEELGVPRLSSGQRDKKEQILDYLLNSDDEAFHWLLSMIVTYMDIRVRPFQRHFYPTYEEEALRSVDTAFSDLNRHLESNDLPYRVVDGRLVNREREVVAKQIEGPALRMLGADLRFAAAAEELDEAIRLLRSPNKADDAIRNASHALESTLDVIANLLGWSLPATRTLHSQLLAAKTNGLLGAREADALTNYFTRLVDSIVAGARNAEPGAGHGQGIGTQPDPMIAEFVVDVACAAVKVLYTAFRRESP